MANKTFYELLKQRREQQGITLSSVAKHINVSIAYYSDVEHGKRGISDEKLKLVCDFLNVQEDNILNLRDINRGYVVISLKNKNKFEIDSIIKFARMHEKA